MKRKKMEKEVVHLLEWIIEYPRVWQIVCNPDGKETSPESFKPPFVPKRCPAHHHHAAAAVQRAAFCGFPGYPVETDGTAR